MNSYKFHSWAHYHDDGFLIWQCCVMCYSLQKNKKQLTQYINLGCTVRAQFANQQIHDFNQSQPAHTATLNDYVTHPADRYFTIFSTRSGGDVIWCDVIGAIHCVHARCHRMGCILNLYHAIVYNVTNWMIFVNFWQNAPILCISSITKQMHAPFWCPTQQHVTTRAATAAQQQSNNNHASVSLNNNSLRCVKE